MKTNSVIRPLLLGALALATLSGCSEDEYISRSPRFSDVTFENIDGSSTIYAGDRIVATAVQGTKGKYLNGTTYAWSVSPSDDVQQKYKTGCIYDNESENPTDTIVFPSSGTYTITLKATYKTSAEGESVSATSTFESGSGTATYSGGLTIQHVTLEKKVKVVKK